MPAPKLALTLTVSGAFALGFLIVSCFGRPPVTPPTLDGGPTFDSAPPPGPHDAAPIADAARPDARPDAAPTPARALAHRGVNLSGAEFGAVPGVLGRDYAYPTSADVDLFVARGMTHIRVPFRHERLQRALLAELDAGEWSRLEALIAYATSRGLSVAIEPHNSARFNGVLLTEAQMGDLWARIARRLEGKSYTPLVMLDLTNEPHDMKTEAWLALAQAAVREIRRAGSTQTILVPGAGWSGAMHWNASWYGTPSSTLLQQVTDEAVVFEVHLYLDADGSGKYSAKDCVSDSIGVERLQAFTAWLRQHRRRGYLGEIGAPNTPTCARAVTNALAAVESEPMLWIGWAWWSAGSRWPSAYQLSLQPLVTDAGVVDRPQLAWLERFLAAPKDGTAARRLESATYSDREPTTGRTRDDGGVSR